MPNRYARGVGAQGTLASPAFTLPTTLFTDSLPLTEVSEARRPAAAAIFGAPLDRTGSFRPGAGEGPSAVRYMSTSLEAYSPILDLDLQDLTLLDLGDLQLASSDMEAALREIAQATSHAASLARLPVMIGGEHTVSLGAYRGIKQLYPDAMLIHVDAHTDLRAEYEGQRLTHATWLYHAGQEFGFENILVLGVRSGAREEWPIARERTAWCSEELVLPEDLLEKLAERPVYLTIDIDVLDPAIAPGTGCPEPGGATFLQVMALLCRLSGLKVVGLDVVEVAPALDPSGITAVAAAKLIRESILLFGTSSSE